MIKSESCWINELGCGDICAHDRRGWLGVSAMEFVANSG
jgi:hypothetical protein